MGLPVGQICTPKAHSDEFLQIIATFYALISSSVSQLLLCDQQGPVFDFGHAITLSDCWMHGFSHLKLRSRTFSCKSQQLVSLNIRSYMSLTCFVQVWSGRTLSAIQSLQWGSVNPTRA